MSLSSSILRFACHRLPPRLAGSTYYRLINGRAQHAASFKNASLRANSRLRMNLLPGDTGHGCIAYCGFYEIDLTRALVQLAEAEGGVLIDAGANYGYFSLIWAAARRENRVIAFEPSPRNYAGLVENVNINNLGEAISTRRLALGSQPGEMFVQMADASQSGWDKISSEADERGDSVMLTTLDAQFPDQRFTALKIELQVLEGAKKLLSEHRVRHIFFESNSVRLAANAASEDAACALLVSLGYTIRHLTPCELHACLS
jgi:FkbM family methyltransferase